MAKSLKIKNTQKVALKNLFEKHLNKNQQQI
jgi:hypothetical protein